MLTSLSYAQLDTTLALNDSDQSFNERPERPGQGRNRRMDDMSDEDGPRHAGPRPPKELTAQEQEQLFKVLEEVNPQLIEKIKKWQDVNPQMSNRMLTRMYGRMRSLIKLKYHDKESYELKVQDLKFDAQNRVLADEYRKNPTEQGREELLAALSKHFDIRQQLRERELAKLKERISKVEASLEKDTANRQKILDKQFKDITNKRSSKPKDQI